MAEALHALGHPILKEQVLGQPGHCAHCIRHGPRSLQPGGHAVVGQLGVVVHHCPVDVRVHQRAIWGDAHVHHHCQAVLAGVQGGEVGGELQGSMGKIWAAV